MSLTRDEVLAQPAVQEAIARGFIVVRENRITYKLNREREYNWADPEEWVRCAMVAFLIIERDYSPKRLDLEVQVPRRVPNDWADIVIFRDDRARDPYLIVECKASGQNTIDRNQGIEQGIGNAHSLRAPLALYTEWTTSILFDTSDAYLAMERTQNRRGDQNRVPAQYSDTSPKYAFIAKEPGSDISPADSRKLENKVRRTHSIIWSGGKRDPLTSFDEWSKLLFAKVHDERTTPNGQPRRFQVGSGESATAVANRVHQLFLAAADQDKTIFPEGTRIMLPDDKIAEVVSVLQDVSIIDTDTDTIGRAFEHFFGSVFRGELGQYFTMRQVARFTVAALDLKHTDYIIDPTAGSGGFLLESLLQGWHAIDRDFAGQSELDRKKYDFAMHRVYGIEIHEILARILKINLLLHHDGHTNIEGDRSCLDTDFLNQRLRTNWRAGFDVVVGNPPFGDNVKAGDRDLLGENNLDMFEVAAGRSQVPSEHVILERAIDMLKPEGRLGLVIPDGLLNNQGEMSNCPAVRRLLARSGHIEAIVSLPDHAFRKSGAQNKTSILFFRKFSAEERTHWNTAYNQAVDDGADLDTAILEALKSTQPHYVFLAEANTIGYTTTGQSTDQNDLYRSGSNGFVADDQSGTILGEMRRFHAQPDTYGGHQMPDCMSMSAVELWEAHPSHRLDPKYFLFKKEEQSITPAGWVRSRIDETMRRREELVQPELKPEEEVTVLTVAQTGELRARQAGKGRTPPEWRGMYFEDMPTKWYATHAGDVVFSGIDLWKGCISVVPPEFDGALVSSEFPVYEVTDDRLDPEFLSTLLRSRYYRRAFRAITTGHSNRRRTQTEDFEQLEICFPADDGEQRKLVADVLEARTGLRHTEERLRQAMLEFSDVIDNRGAEEYEDVVDGDEDTGE